MRGRIRLDGWRFEKATVTFASPFGTVSLKAQIG
jgi:hypothetical protein